MSLENISYRIIKPYLEEYLLYGRYPEVVMAETHEEKKRILKTIIGRFLERDFENYLKRDELIDFRRLLQFVTRSVGSIWKSRKIAQQVGISAYKVDKYIQFLVDSYILEPVYPFFSDATKEYNSHKELFFHDHGLINYFRDYWVLDNQIGQLNENLVATMVLKKYRDELPGGVHYRKTSVMTEIDFVIKTPKGLLVPVEVKSGDKAIVPKVFHSFIERYKSAVEYGIVTTQSIRKKKEIDDKDVMFIPVWAMESESFIG